MIPLDSNLFFQILPSIRSKEGNFYKNKYQYLKWVSMSKNKRFIMFYRCFGSIIGIFEVHSLRKICATFANEWIAGGIPAQLSPFTESDFIIKPKTSLK